MLGATQSMADWDTDLWWVNPVWQLDEQRGLHDHREPVSPSPNAYKHAILFRWEPIDRSTNDVAGSPKREKTATVVGAFLDVAVPVQLFSVYSADTPKEPSAENKDLIKLFDLDSMPSYSQSPTSIRIRPQPTLPESSENRGSSEQRWFEFMHFVD